MNVRIFDEIDFVFGRVGDDREYGRMEMACAMGYGFLFSFGGMFTQAYSVGAKMNTEDLLLTKSGW